MTTAPSGDTANDKSPDRREERSFDVRRRLIAGLMVVVCLILGGVGWAATARLAGAIIAHGTVVVKRHVKKVQHRDGGIVANIYVKDGDVVEAGDVVVRLDDTQIRAELGVIQARFIELTGRAARLAAQRDDRATIGFPKGFAAVGPEAPRVMRGETRLFEGDRTARQSKKEQLQLRIGQSQDEIKGLTAQRDAKVSELAFIKKELKQVQFLFEQKLTQVTRLYALQREAARIAGELGSLDAGVARAKGQISEVRLQILAIDQTSRTEAQRELRDTEAKMAETTERRIAVIDRLNRVEMRAPRSGIVHELAVHTVGGVITPAEPVMLIVPRNDDLTVEAQVLPTDIDQIKTGQPARLRLSAFNQRVTPQLQGQVINVAADVTRDPKSGYSYYLTRIAIDADSLKTLGDHKLIPGMPVEVFVTTGERTALSYLVKPFSDQLERAFKEE